MIHPGEGDTSTVRSVFIIDPDNKVRLTLTYPKSRRPQLRRDRPRHRRAAGSPTPQPVSTPVDWKPGEQGHRRADDVDRGRQAKFGDVEEVKPYLRWTPQPKG